jgi:hypothetical protein
MQDHKNILIRLSLLVALTLSISACAFKPTVGMSYTDFVDMSQRSMRGKPELAEYAGPNDFIVQVDQRQTSKRIHGVVGNSEEDFFYLFRNGRLKSVMTGSQYERIKTKRDFIPSRETVESSDDF